MEHAFSPVKPVRAFEGVVVQIENAIIEGRLRVGDRLPPERELVETFQVSRASVREALRVLESLGVLSARRGTGADSGSIVSADNGNPLSSLLRLHVALLQVPLSDLLDVREVVEVLTARQATARASDEDLYRLRDILASMQATYEPEDFMALDTEFHVSVAKASGNTVAPLIMTALRDAIAREGLRAFKVLQESGTWDRQRAWLIEDHTTLLEAIESRDPDAAAEAFSHHVRDFYETILAPEEARKGAKRTRRRTARRGSSKPSVRLASPPE